MSKRQDIATALLGIFVALILWITILSRDVQMGRMIVFRPFHSFVFFWKDVQRGGIQGNFIGNLILFIPVGLLLPMAGVVKKWYWILAVSVSFSLLIEVAQLITTRGCFDPDDLLLNAIGTMIGWLLWKTARRIIDSKTSR